MLQPEQKKELARIALQFRYNILEMIGTGNAGHLGGSSSLAELMAVLYFNKMNFNAEKLDDPQRDRLVQSKGHAALIQYAALCAKGCFPGEELKKVKQINALLQGHPDLSIPGIEAVTGSLGQGLSISVGMALALRLDNNPARVYTIMGDGEQSEGQIWEAAMAAANYRLDNITAFIDFNKLQATGETKNIFDIPDLEKKWAAFGWNVLHADGHDFDQIDEAIEKAKVHKGQPSVIIIDTVKGKGFSFAEGNPAYHNGILTEETYSKAVSELNAKKAELQ